MEWIRSEDCMIKELGYLAFRKNENKTSGCLTETEIGKAMNNINTDLQFTTETESDFIKKRLPTLSFELWSTIDGVRHSYYEKEIRSQILTMDRSSMPENAKFSILVNELNRRFEVMDSKIDQNEIVAITIAKLMRSY